MSVLTQLQPIIVCVLLEDPKERLLDLPASDIQLHYCHTPDDLVESATLVLADWPYLMHHDALHQRLQSMSIPIVCLVSVDQAEQALRWGVDDVLPKPPASPALLRHRIRQTVSLWQHRRATQQTFADTIQHTLQLLAKTHDPKELLRQILMQMRRVMPPYNAANVMLLNADNTTVTDVRLDSDGSGSPELQENVLRLSRLAYLEQMLHDQQPIIIHDTLSAKQWKPLEHTRWIRAYVAVPIIIGDEFLGFLSLNDHRPYSFNEEYLERLTAFSYYVGIAIQNARLFEERRHLTATLEKHVSERTQALQAEQATLQTVLNTIGSGVLYHDTHGNAMYINRALRQMFGYDDEQWLKGLVYDKIGLESAEKRATLGQQVQQALETRGVWQHKTLLQRADGNQFHAQITVRRVHNEAGEYVGAVTVYRDISQEQALQDQQARFVAYTSHELRTPITNLKTQLYLIKRKSRSASMYLEVIEEVVDRMGNLVEDLLHISQLKNRQIQVEQKPLIMQNVINRVLRVQRAEAEAKHIRLTQTMPDIPLTLDADYDRLLQVFTNLISNAIQHTPAYGRIELRVRVGPAPTAYIEADDWLGYETGILQWDGPWVAVDVQDSGQGISSEHLQYLFQPFYRVSDDIPGTGLGLTISNEIVRKHHGLIKVTSQLGEGSCFTVWLPMSKPEPDA